MLKPGHYFHVFINASLPVQETQWQCQQHQMGLISHCQQRSIFTALVLAPSGGLAAGGNGVFITFQFVSGSGRRTSCLHSLPWKQSPGSPCRFSLWFWLVGGHLSKLRLCSNMLYLWKRACCCITNLVGPGTLFFVIYSCLPCQKSYLNLKYSYR